MLSGMAPPPTLFIVIPVRNGAAFLRSTLDSVEAQDLAGCRVHLHVQDGASTDATMEIVRECASRRAMQAPDSGLAFTSASSPDGGMYDAISRAIAGESRRFFDPDVFFWLNSDDILMPSAIKNLAATFRDQSVHWAIGAAVDIDAQGAVLLCEPHRRIPSIDLVRGNFNFTGGHWLRAESTAMRMAAARECGLFTAGLRLAGDYDLFVKLARHSPPTYVDYAVRGFRRHAGQLSQSAVEYQHERSQAKHFLSVADGAVGRMEHASRSPQQAREIVFYPDCSARDAYQTLLYATASAQPAESVEALDAACRQASQPLVVHIHWLDEIIRLPRGAAGAGAQALADVILAARHRGHRVVFTLHGLADPASPNADVEAKLVEFLFAHADIVHMHHPAVAAEVRGRLQTFPWRRVVFAEHGQYPRAPTAGEPAVTPPAGFTFLSERDAATPAPLFHALSTGNPVIAPRCGLVPSYVFEGYNGFLYQPNDAASRNAALARAETARSEGRDHDLKTHAVQAVAHLDWRMTLDAILRRLP